MRKLSTLCIDDVRRKEDDRLEGSGSPRKQTLDFLRQFARVYQSEPVMHPELRGFVMN